MTAKKKPASTATEAALKAAAELALEAKSAADAQAKFEEAIGGAMRIAPAKITPAMMTPAVDPSAIIEPAPSATVTSPDMWKDIITKYSPAFKDIAKPVAAKAEEPEPAFTPGELVIPPGMSSLADLITGCNPIPVQVFNELDWPEAIRSYIPKALPNDGKWHWPIELVNELAFALYCGDRTLLHGPTGSGKSALAEAWCFLTRTPLIRVNCYREMQSTDFLGKDIIRATAQGPVLEYDWSMTTLGAKYGGLLLIDEAFRSPHLMAIQSLLERNGTLTLPDAASLTPAERHIVPPQGKSWVVLTDNSVGTGDDTGAYVSEVQDVSTLDRITAAIYIDYTKPEQEAKELAEDFVGVPKIKVLDPLTQWAAKMRAAIKDGNMQQPISRRALGAILRKYVITADLSRAVQLSYLNKLGKQDLHKAREAWMQVFGEELA